MKTGTIALLATIVVIGIVVIGIVVIGFFGGWSLANTPLPVDKTPVDFARDVMPLFNRLGCNTAQCHGAAAGRGRLSLSLFGAEPGRDFTMLTKEAGGRRIDRVRPTESLLLKKILAKKATEGVTHGGGKRLEVGSPEYATLLAWIAQGARPADENGPTLTRLEILPSECILKPGETKSLSVTAVFSDDATRDVAADAVFTSAEEQVAVVDPSGNVSASGHGQSAITIGYMRQFATVRVVVPQVLPLEFPALDSNNKIDELVHAKLKELGIGRRPVLGRVEHQRVHV